MRYHGKRFDQDAAAQQTYAFGMDARNMHRGDVEERCSRCSGPLKVYYCEDGLYMVRCQNCGIVALTGAKNPSDAARKTIGG